MTSHTVKAESGRQINVRPSRVRPGLIEITILNSCREVLASCTLDPSSADVIGRAASMEALAVEAMCGEFTVEVKPMDSLSSKLDKITAAAVELINKRGAAHIAAFEAGHGYMPEAVGVE